MNQAYIQQAKKIMHTHGVSYFLATRFFPRDIREAVYILYAFVRLPDELVDNPKEDENSLEKIYEWKKNWQQSIDTGVGTSWIFEATLELHKTYNIPFKYSLDFIDAMIQDVHQSRYDTYESLHRYIYGSAETVGCMLSHIFGFQGDALLYAKKLGEAMQMTNFLRDVHDDYVTRNRVYIPEDDLRHFGITESMIACAQVTDELRTYMKYEIEHTRNLYEEAKKGIPLLSRNARIPVALALVLYREILSEIEKAGYDIFSHRVKTSRITKIRCILKVLWNKKQWGL